MENILESRADFSIRLDGDNNIDALLLSEMIKSFDTLTKHVARISQPEAQVELKVSAFNEGSFEICFDTIIELAPTLLFIAPEIQQYAPSVIKSIKGMLDVKKHLGGERPKKIEISGDNNIVISGNNNIVLTVPKEAADVLDDPMIDKAVSQIAEIASKRGNDFAFCENGEETVYSPHDFPKMRTLFPHEEIVTSNTHIKTSMTSLPIRTANMADKKSKETSVWNFFHDNKRINATINDTAWLERFRNNEFTIGHGYSMEVELETTIKLDEDNIPIPKTEVYIITRVIAIVPPTEQLTIAS